MSTGEPVVYSIWVSITTICFIVIIFIAIFRPYIMVSQGHAVVMQRFGRFSCVRKSGIHPRIPIIDQPFSVKWQCLKEVSHDHNNEPVYESELFNESCIAIGDKTYDMIPLECYTNDNLVVTINLVAYYKITDLEKAVYSPRNHDLYRHMNDDTESKLTEIIREMSAASLTQPSIEGKLMDRIKWTEIGVKLLRMRVSGLIFPKEIDAAIISSMEQKRRLDMEKLERQSDYEKADQILSNEENLLKRRRQIELDSLTHQKSLNEANRIEKQKDAALILEIQKDQLKSGLTEVYLIAEKQADAMIISSKMKQI